MGYIDDKILVLGGTGLLGSTLVPYLNGCGYEIECHGRTGISKHNADISIEAETFKLMNAIKPSVIVNLVGITNVDACEANPNSAYIGNVKVIENITKWMKSSDLTCHLIHISTDQVYDGHGPHHEMSLTLTNYYAFSKYAGELVAASVPSTILRTNFFGLSYCVNRQSLSDWLYNSLMNNDHIQVFDDVIFSPLSMVTLSKMINLAVQLKIVGTFNLGSCEGMSKADFSYTFASLLDLLPHNISRTTSDQVSFLKTYRPKDMRMDCKKFENAFSLTLPTLLDEINLAVKDYYGKASNDIRNTR